MATTGSVPDIINRLQSALPTRWFPTQAVNSDGTVPRIYALLTAFATALAQVYAQVTYAKAQTRIQTSTDGFLDVAAWDYFGPSLYRLPGEKDAAFRQRIITSLFLPANTRASIQTVISNLTGAPIRVSEPWRPADGGVWDGMYYDIDTAVSPGRYSNGDLHGQSFVDAVLPYTQSFGNNPYYTYESEYYDANGYFDDNGSVNTSGVKQIYDAINRMKAEGTIIWVRQTGAAVAPNAPPPPPPPPPPTTVAGLLDWTVPGNPLFTAGP